MIKKTVFLSVIILMFLSEKNAFTQETDPGLRKKISVHMRALDSRNWEKAVEELIHLGEPAVDPLIKLLTQNSGYPSARACHALAGIGTPKAVKALKAVFRNKRFHYQVKNYALSALVHSLKKASCVISSASMGSPRMRKERPCTREEYRS